MDPVETVMELACVDRVAAQEALAEHKEVWLAVDALLARPPVAGDRFLPPPPEIDHGLTPEQEALCRRGRWLQDQVNAVFSVAHSKIRNQPDPDSPVPGDGAPPHELPEEAPCLEQSPQSTTVPPPDSPEQTTQPGLQSDPPQ